MYSAHAGMEHATNRSNTLVVIVLVTIIIWALLFIKLWWLKRYTSWQFPLPSKKKGTK
jgi:hypothetical protein